MPNYSRQVKIPGKSAQDLYTAVSQGIDRFLSKSSLGKYEVHQNPEQKEIRAKGSMFTATLRCGESVLDLNVQLSLLAMPFRSKLDEGIDRWLASTFQLSNSPSDDDQ